MYYRVILIMCALSCLFFPREAIQISNLVSEVNYEFNLCSLIVQLNRILIDCRIIAKMEHCTG